ncbi:MAG TPA: hypothetical protein VF006_08460 [Longimicrobium sp.]
MTNAEFAALREEITPALAALPDSLGPVQPGDAFQPTVMRIPSWPEADFLWPDTRLGTFLVSERVLTLWKGMDVTGAVFSRVEFEGVGRRKASAPLRRHGGEPEDAYRRIPAGGELDAVPVYHMVTVTGTTGLPAEIGRGDVCPECARVLTKPNDPGWRWTMTPEMWNGDDVALRWPSHTGGGTVITDRVKEALEEQGVTNVSFELASG